MQLLNTTEKEQKVHESRLITIKFGIIHEIQVDIDLDDIVSLSDAISIAANKLSISLEQDYNVINQNKLVDKSETNLIPGSEYKILFQVGIAG